MSLSIGICCYPTIGGSGIVATEIGLAMAARGHQVHFITSGVPHRLKLPAHNVHVHPVSARQYHVFDQPPYALALSSAIVQVATTHGLDVVHAHYAVPHAASAWMAKEMLGNQLRVVTTLHGTDITLIGSDPSYLPITRHSILKSDVVTVPSAFLREATYDRLGLPREVPIEVVPNFVDAHLYRPRTAGDADPTSAFFPEHAHLPLLLHVSNFRPLKRVDRVLQIAQLVAQQTPCRLLLVGDGPDAASIDALLPGLGLPARRVTTDLHLDAILRSADVFLLPSETEGFGLAALEAMASGVPVVASNVGGLPEVVVHGSGSWLHAPDDVSAMAQSALRAIEEGPSARAAARARALLFESGPVIDRFEALYRNSQPTNR